MWWLRDTLRIDVEVSWCCNRCLATAMPTGMPPAAAFETAIPETIKEIARESLWERHEPAIGKPPDARLQRCSSSLREITDRFCDSGKTSTLREGHQGVNGSIYGELAQKSHIFHSLIRRVSEQRLRREVAFNFKNLSYLRSRGRIARLLDTWKNIIIANKRRDYCRLNNLEKWGFSRFRICKLVIKSKQSISSPSKLF